MSHAQTHYQLDELHFTVHHSQRRKTAGITVERDGTLLLHLPEQADMYSVDSFIRNKRMWIFGKLAEKELLTESAYPHREFRDGEGFCYLGRTYQLKTLKESPVSLQFRQGRFLLAAAEIPHARQHFIDWYRQKALERLPALLDEYTQRSGQKHTGLRVMDLGNRWASCSDKGVLNFHWKVMQLPNRFLHYVVAHEVIHLQEKHHTPHFWLLLERLLPEFAALKADLSHDALNYLRLS